MPRHTGARVVIILGASSGIGRATAHALARRGDTLVLAARSVEGLAEVERECLALAERAGHQPGPGEPRVLTVPTDVSHRDAVERLFTAASALYGRVDAVVHAPAVVAYGRFEEVPADVFDHVVAVDLTGTANVAREALRHFRAGDGGHLVVVGSLLGKVVTPWMSSYVTSKWGVHGLVRTLQAEVRHVPGIEVSLVSPGGVDTPIYAQAASYARREGRPPPPVDRPEKVARAIVRLLGRPRRETSVGPANHLYTFGFRFVPGVFDVIVAPVMSRFGLSGTPSPEPHTGNVFAPLPLGESVHGKWGRHWQRWVVFAGSVAGTAATVAGVRRAARGSGSGGL
ncbi:SDR family NAD(P)-dependent oxidoreductase [Cellulomonas aerilata]|uniref:Short-chain dehydrogenase n=1 Tax=Cellulomonas aerilata TaxID=515326 RepID=A0A512D8B4_9CELL|nr:SDR family NAD(P)-dependent oxidoreductase [Cellulomonas aerilata]GEO32510.1 short-chain dehydrogenase [Cellulomonas aerilata]